MKKDESFLGKLGGTLARKKKAREVSDLQEEGKNAINSPLSPAAVDLHPEETLLGTVGPALSLSWDSCAPVARTWPQRGVTATAF